MPKYKAMTDRNLEIYTKRKEGATYQSLANEYGVSLGRIQELERKIEEKVKQSPLYNQAFTIKFKKLSRKDKEYARSKK